MAFSVSLKLIPPADSNFEIGEIVFGGEPPKPNKKGLAGKAASNTHRCHIQAYSILKQSLSQTLVGRTLRDAAVLMGASTAQAGSANASYLRKLCEDEVKKQLGIAQKDVENYYNGAGSANMSGGGRMSARAKKIWALWEGYPTNGTTMQQNAANKSIFKLQKEYFSAGYDSSPFATEQAKLYSRGEYVARINQMAASNTKSKFLVNLLVEDASGQTYMANFVSTGRL